MAGRSVFFKLPREIRDEVYTLVLNDPVAPPLSPHNAGVRYKENIDEECGFDRGAVFYPLPTNRFGFTFALSCCNRQLRQEVHDLVTKPHLPKSVTYKLDVMLQGYRLWPTWIAPCYPATTIDRLQIDLRLFDVLYGGQSFWGCGGPGAAYVVLFRALNRLLHHGPAFLHHDASHTLKINTLIINVMHGYGKVFQPSKNWIEGREDPEGDYQRFIDKDQRAIYQSICGMLEVVKDEGLLSDKIQTLKVCNATHTDVSSTSGIAPIIVPSDEWIRWGFIWGIDKDMKIDKIDSEAFLRREDEKRDMQRNVRQQ
ncbi:MAG: hypothetical protein Q9169_004671 [Polycauliona sp. 2 TL-2023]